MKQKIKLAALRLFLKHGPKRATIDDVVWELQIPKKVFYEYFSNKEELILEIFNEVIDEARNALVNLSREENDSLTLLLLWQHYFYCYLKKYSASCVYEINKYYDDLVESYWSFRNNVVFKKLMTFAGESQKQGILRDDVNIRIFIEMQLYSLEELLFGRFIETNKPSEQEQDSYASHIISVNNRGVIANAYIEDYEQYLIKIKGYECSER